MKKIFLILVSVIHILSCTSCVREELPYLTEPIKIDENVAQVYSYNPTDDGLENVKYPEIYNVFAELFYSNGELYFRSNDMYYKLNKERGNMSPFCKDPICNHKTSECPFYGFTFSGFYIYEDSIIYTQSVPIGEDRSETLNIYDVEKDERRILHHFDGKSSRRTTNMTFYNGELLFTDIVKNEKTKEYVYSLCSVNLKTGKKRILLSEAWQKSALMSDENGVYYADVKKKKILYAKNNDLNNTEELPFYNTRFYFVGDKVIYIDDNGYLTSSDRYGNDKKNLRISNVDNFFVTDKYIYYRHKGTVEIGKILTPTVSGKIEEIIEYNFNSIYRCDHEGNNVQEVIHIYDGEPLETGESVYLTNSLFFLSGYYYTPYTRFTMGEDGYLEVYNSRDNQDFEFLRINIETGEKYIIKVPNIYVNH